MVCQGRIGSLPKSGASREGSPEPPADLLQFGEPLGRRIVTKRTPEKIGHSIELVRWLYWQVLRRSSEYRKQVSALLACWRRDARLEISQKGPNPAESNFRQGRVRAVKTSLCAYHCMRQGRSTRGPFLLDGKPVTFGEGISTADIPPANSIGKLPSEFYQREQELMMVIQEAETHRFFSVGAAADSLIKRLSSGERQDGLPELVDFRQKWGLRFPIPPSVELPLEEVMENPWTQPLEILEQRPESVTLHIYPEAGREILLSFIGGALWHHLRKLRNPGQKGRSLVSHKPGARDTREILKIEELPDKCLRFTLQLHNGKLLAHKHDVLQEVQKHLSRSAASFRTREDYEAVFQIVDLRKQGFSRPEIVKRMWPGLAKDTLSVRNLERSFQALAKTFHIPL